MLPAAGFASPSRAQLWFEWRQHGWTLPAMVGMVVPAELLLLFIPSSNGSPTVLLTLFFVIVTPVLLATFAAGALATPMSFAAIRPLTTASLVAAKLKMSILSTLAAWAVLLALVALALEWSGRADAVIQRALAVMEVTGPVRFATVAVLLIGAAIAVTWTHLVQSLCIGLSGRPWLIRSTVLVALTSLVALGPALDWLWHRADVLSAIWHRLPWILAALVLVKATAASAIAARLQRRRLLTDRALIGAALCWFITVAALYGVQVWLAASPLVPRYYLAVWAILPVPLARIAAAPLALAWSRHR
jgi:hypothetical protein